jgi:hypothetical protein
MLLSWNSALFPLGCLDQARARSDEALAEARQLRQAFTLAMALGQFLLLFEARLGERDPSMLSTTLRLSEELVTLAAEHDFPQCGA